MTVSRPLFLFYCWLILIFYALSEKSDRARKCIVYHLDEESLQVDLRSRIDGEARWKRRARYASDKFCYRRDRERNVGKAGRLSLSACKLADASAKVNDMVDTWWCALCSRKPVFVGGVTGFGEICTDIYIYIICARALLNGEEIYYPWTTWKGITSESGLGPSNPDSSDFTAFQPAKECNESRAWDREESNEPIAPWTYIGLKENQEGRE